MNVVVTIVGTRPEFIRAAVVSREIQKMSQGEIKEVVINTGQHYDYELSRIFFDQLGMSPPDFNLGVGSRDRANQVSEMLRMIGDLLGQLKPTLVIVHGDTNSTLAGAIAARCHHIPVAHVEAGLRSGDAEMVEEQNRILVDHLSSVLYCPTATAVENLRREGIFEGVRLIGDLSFDAHLWFANKVESSLSDRLRLPKLPQRYFLATIHRAENTDDPSRLREIIEGLDAGMPCVFPVHPRTLSAMAAQAVVPSRSVTVLEPVGFLEMLHLESKCEFVLTDSGGVQKEAYFFHKPCITVRDSTEWIETVESCWNRLVPAKAEAIRLAVRDIFRPTWHPDLFGNGSAASELVNDLISFREGI